MEQEIRKIIYENTRSLSIDEETKKFKQRILFLLQDEYKLPRNIVDIRDLDFTIELLKKKVLKSYVDLIVELTNNKDITSLMGEISKFNAERIIESQLEDLGIKLKKLSNIPQYEMLYGQFKREYNKYIDSVNEVIYKNQKTIKSNLNNININIDDKDYTKSTTPSITEMFGVYYDENEKCFFTEVDGSKRKLNDEQINKNTISFQIDDKTKMLMTKVNENNMALAIMENNNIVKTISYSNNKFMFSNGTNCIIHDLKTDEIEIKIDNEEYKFNLNTITEEQIEEFVEIIGSLDSNVKGYYQRTQPKLFISKNARAFK